MSRLSRSFYAHSANDRGDRHEWAEHAEGTARLASSFAGSFGMEEWGYLLGLWHDVGKLADDWQRYLAANEAGRAPRGGPDHKAAGAQLAMRFLGPVWGERIGLLLRGHHGGLDDPSSLQEWLERQREQRGAEARNAVREAQHLVPDLIPTADLGLPSSGIAATDERADLLLRLLFSCLVDADWLDTEAHFSPEVPGVRRVASDLNELRRRFGRAQMGILGSVEGPVGEARDAIHAASVEAARQPPGLFRLTVPTGGGKTRSGMSFALEHAHIHGQRRVIVVVPYISITEQTAGTYRTIFEHDGDSAPAVLEHHSGADELVGAPGGEASGARPWARLAAENWDAPVVVTTTVQLFESLFDRRPGRMRKLHRLANSVIILDEVQALPRKFLAPILDALRALCDHYGTTVVLSTATQPAFEVIPEFADASAYEIVPRPDRWFERLRRVDYERPDSPLSWKAVADLMRDEPRALAIVNTKRDALALLDAVEAAGRGGDALHLSTLLCGAHRRDVLDAVKRRLDDEKPCLLISTQVVEAGVDLDFPVVLRAVGPLDAIVQAAGRCNREGDLDRGRVVVFEPADPSPLPASYRLAAELGRDATRYALGADGRPDDPGVQRRYFERLLTLSEADGEEIQPRRAAFDFQEVARRFRMIEPTVSVVVRYGDNERQAEVDGLIGQLQDAVRAGYSGRAALRALQPYMVAFHASQLRGLGDLMSEVAPGVYEWTGVYDDGRGSTGGRGIVLQHLTVDDYVL